MNALEKLVTAAVQILEQQGPLELIELGKAAVTTAPLDWEAEAGARTLFRLAANKEHDLAFIEYPVFRLRTRARPDWLARTGWRAAAYKLLSERDGGVAFDEMLRAITQTANFRFNQGCPALQLYSNLTDGDGQRLFSRSGSFTIGVVAARRSSERVPIAQVRREPKLAANSRAASEGLHEANLEGFIACDLDQIEPGLTLIGRQHSVPPVGRIDLLCRDRKGSLVIIEIKTPDASTDSVIDQIEAYVGWVMEHMAAPGQRVRGIIICGRPNPRLAYAVRAVPNLSIKFVNLGLEDYDPRSSAARS
jgi:hypothetical protein